MLKAMLVAVALCGCGGTPVDTGGTTQERPTQQQPTCVVDGRYRVIGSENAGGTCGAAAFPDTLTMSKSGSQYTMTWASLGSANGCAATVTGCSLTATCKYTWAGVSWTARYAYAFTAGGFTGTETASFVGCTSTYSEAGTRQ